MTITESIYSQLQLKIIGAIFFGFGAYKFEINPGFFSFLIGIGTLMLITTRASLVVNRTTLFVHKGKILDFFIRPKQIKLHEIEDVEYEPPKLNWKLAAISLVAPGFKLRNPKRLYVNLKDGTWITIPISGFLESDLQPFIKNLKSNTTKKSR